jgi:hypothetical protein
MLESESRWASVIQTRWAAIADPDKLTISGWVGFAITHLESIIRKQQRNRESVLCCFVGYR